MRKGKAPKRYIQPDDVYQNLTVAKFINHIMRRGKKETARSIFYGALEIGSQKSGMPPLQLLTSALSNASPVLGVKKKRVRGATIQVPVEVPANRRLFLGMNWLIQAAKQRHERVMAERLAAEMVAAAQNEGGAIKEKIKMQKVAESNKAFSHYSG